MERRNFLKVLLTTSLYLAGYKLFPNSGSLIEEVGIVKGTDYARAVRRAIDLIGGIGRYVKTGNVVAIKPNMSFNSPPELKANTDPTVVGTVVRLCYEAGASRVYVFDRTLTSPKLSYRTSGIEAAAKKAGAKVPYVDKVSSKLYREVTVPGAEFLGSTLVNRYVLDADVFINIPVAKSHSLAGLTMGMKNLMGITGDRRSRWHWQLNTALVEINMAVKSHLTVIDATNIMVKNGPTGGSLSFLKRMDTIIASTNVVCADSEGARLFGRAPESLSYLKLAQDRGLGRLSGYKISKDFV